MRQVTMTVDMGRDLKRSASKAKRHTHLVKSLGLHEILVAYALSILLPQTALFRSPSRPVIRQLGLVEQLPQPRRVLLVGKGEHGGLILEVVQSDEDGVRCARGLCACACACACQDVSCCGRCRVVVGCWVVRDCSPPVWGVSATVVRSGTALGVVATVDLDANGREWSVRVGCRSRKTREMNMGGGLEA